MDTPLRAGGMNAGFSPAVFIVAQPAGGCNGGKGDGFHETGNPAATRDHAPHLDTGAAAWYNDPEHK